MISSILNRLVCLLRGHHTYLSHFTVEHVAVMKERTTSVIIRCHRCPYTEVIKPRGSS